MARKIDPRLHPEMFYVGLRIPIPVVNLLDRLAARQLRTRSDIARSLIVEALQAKGLAASPDEISRTAA